ncbi:MAG: ABC transporter ATP-binding protein [Phenylobacterium sp.]|uniref:ABC transporter ATP-binding protein n=1 Tax=Phenylobacterium sp. TaxID=1871053 RepID=UPI00391B49F7
MLENTAPSAPDALKVAGLRKIYEGGRGVSGVDLSVPAGAITGFIGVNGAGKSTTLKAVMGLVSPQAGRIEILGEPSNFESRRAVGFLPEERGLAPRERARDVIAFHGRLKGMDRRRAYARADELLERIGLAGRRRARIEDLSKGNAQRVQILCALVHKPALLVLDEPFTGLDPIAQAEVQSLFAEQRARGGAILFSTHSMAVAERLCDRVAILAGGRTVFEGEVAEAAAHAPNGAYVTLEDAEALLEVAAALGGEARPFPSRMGEALRWRVLLPAHVPYVSLMRAMAERGLAIQGFEPIEPGLEGAFWALSEKKAA